MPAAILHLHALATAVRESGGGPPVTVTVTSMEMALEDYADALGEVHPSLGRVRDLPLRAFFQRFVDDHGVDSEERLPRWPTPVG